MSVPLHLEIAGTPAPQGSKVRMPTGQHVEASAGLGLWRRDLIDQTTKKIANTAGVASSPVHPAGVPVDVDITFWLPPPKRLAQHLERGIPTLPVGKPDGDKLRRAVLDALKLAGVYADDSQVVGGDTRKRWAWARPTGATIDIIRVEPAPPVTLTFTGSGRTTRVHLNVDGRDLTLCGRPVGDRQIIPNAVECGRCLNVYSLNWPAAS